MNLQHWFTLEILHEYFDNEVCSVFELMPMPTTKRLLKNYNIHIKKHENQYHGYVNVGSSKNIWEELPVKYDLYFQLINTDTDFDNYTDVSLPKKEGALLYLTNSDIPVSTTKEELPSTTYLPVQSLHFQVETVSESPTSVVVKDSYGQEVFNRLTHENQSSISVDISVFGTGIYQLWIADKLSKTFIGTSEKLESHCYGIFHLQMKSMLTSLKNTNPPLFKVNFTARAAYWQYAVIIPKDKKITVQDIHIEGTDDKEFSGPEKKMIGKEEAKLFTSPTTIKLHESARASPLLKMRYNNDFSDTVLELDIKMPVPKASVMITKKENDENLFYSQSIIYV